ncbi:MAG: SUMF1/EgtB/PvdO family nonheme iron enzyme [Candidatus Adiutrix sp.]|jgi:formylglycine-generating enzyme required for sulfatase activity|nr:SUMF1/EgtB/PvdO family nonheme iron enzyme [Candidatus Adiutrix sp.]
MAKTDDQMTDNPALLPGVKLGAYLVTGELGRGREGFTYKALNLAAGQPVVIKEYLPRDLAGRCGHLAVVPRRESEARAFQAGVETFFSEARALAAFKHPNIAPVIDYFRDNGTAYMVAHFIEGETLAGSLARRPGGRLPDPEILAWLGPILEALKAVHGAGFNHLDIKLENIFLTTGGQPILLDFGSTRTWAAAEAISGDRPGGLQTCFDDLADRSGEDGVRADYYALGEVIYRCLTGTDPLPALGRHYAILKGEPDPLLAKINSLTPAVSPELSSILTNCLSLKPDSAGGPDRAPSARLRLIFLAVGAALLYLLFSFLANNDQSASRSPTMPPAVVAERPPEPADPDVYTNSLGVEFQLIPAGTFIMGAHEDGQAAVAVDWEKPAHQVTLSRPFYLGRYEVTQAQWVAVMGSNPSAFEGPAHPVDSVSWNDAQEFIRRLNRLEGTDKYRLPTEAEWEYAARAGTTTRYSFGDHLEDLGDYAWYDENAQGTSHPAGQKRPNPWGLYDMAGNVWEWVEDVYAPYGPEAVTDPVRAGGGDKRVDRGGGWISFPRSCRSSHRYGGAPEPRLNFLGFRLAFTPPGQQQGY